jgi:hypothetical protein
MTACRSCGRSDCRAQSYLMPGGRYRDGCGYVNGPVLFVPGPRVVNREALATLTALVREPARRGGLVLADAAEPGWAWGPDLEVWAPFIATMIAEHERTLARPARLRAGLTKVLLAAAAATWLVATVEWVLLTR